MSINDTSKRSFLTIAVQTANVRKNCRKTLRKRQKASVYSHAALTYLFSESDNLLLLSYLISQQNTILI